MKAMPISALMNGLKSGLKCRAKKHRYTLTDRKALHSSLINPWLSRQKEQWAYGLKSVRLAISGI